MTQALRSTCSKRPNGTSHVFHRVDPQDGDALCGSPGEFLLVDTRDYPDSYYRWCQSCEQIHQERGAEQSTVPEASP